MGFALLLNLPLGCSEVGASCFQGGYHLIWCDRIRVIKHGVDLPETPKTIPHLFHAFQPLQG